MALACQAGRGAPATGRQGGPRNQVLLSHSPPHCECSFLKGEMRMKKPTSSLVWQSPAAALSRLSCPPPTDNPSEAVSIVKLPDVRWQSSKKEGARKRGAQTVVDR